MADVQLSVRSEREADVAVLFGESTNVDGNQANTLVLPAGFGDCWILRAAVYVKAIATMMSNPTLQGPGLWLVSSGVFSEFLAGPYWGQTFPNVLATTWEPEQARLWRDGEKLQVEYTEVDTDASPTADVWHLITVLRRRNVGSRPGRAGRGRTILTS